MEPNNRTEMSFQFIPWVTLAKVLGLYLMVLGHMQLVDSNTSAFIYTFHMPLFFILSGMFTKETNNPTETGKKLYKKLLLPFLLIASVWCIIYMGLWIKNGIIDLCYWSNYILGSFISPGKTLGSLHTLKQPLWFLLALAEIKFIAVFIKNHKLLIIFSIVCIIIILLLHHFNMILPFAIDSAFFAFPFFAIGKMIRNSFLTESKRIGTLLLFFLFTGIGTYIIYLINGDVDTNNCMYGNYIVLYYLGGFTGSICIFTLSQIISRFYQATGPINTLVVGATLIIGFSGNLSSIIREILPFLGTSNIGGIAIALLTMAALYPFILLAQKYFPAILGKRK